jgi:hypothetical protein
MHLHDPLLTKTWSDVATQGRVCSLCRTGKASSMALPLRRV